MPPIFLATMGQRPEAITTGFDKLCQQYHYTDIGILLTDKEKSGIAGAYNSLRAIIHEQYPDVAVHEFIIKMKDKTPIIDIDDAETAEAYYRDVLTVFKQYREQGWQIHLLVAGGRKAMSIYATLAASLVFGTHDMVWTVLSSAEFIRTGLTHVPPQWNDHVQVVRLPIMPSRFLPGMLAGIDVDDIIALQDSPRERFLADLTERERVVAETISSHPYYSYAEIGALLNRSERTIENQLSSIYAKMLPYFEVKQNQKKKQALMDIIHGKI